MAKLPSQFNHEEHEKIGDFTPIPRGEYLAQVVESEIKMTKKAKESGKPADGQFISLKFKIIQGESEGRILFTNLNIINPNQQAVEIANRELATICEAMGLGPIDETEELHGIPVVIRVEVSPETASQPARNEIKGYKSADGFVPEQPATRTAGAVAPSRPGVSKPAWKK